MTLFQVKRLIPEHVSMGKVPSLYWQGYTAWTTGFQCRPVFENQVEVYMTLQKFFWMDMEFTGCRPLIFRSPTNYGLKIWKEGWNPLQNGVERWNWQCAEPEQNVRTFLSFDPSSQSELGRISTVDMGGFLLALRLGRDPRNQRVRRPYFRLVNYYI